MFITSIKLICLFCCKLLTIDPASLGLRFKHPPFVVQSLIDIIEQGTTSELTISKQNKTVKVKQDRLRFALQRKLTRMPVKHFPLCCHKSIRIFWEKGQWWDKLMSLVWQQPLLNFEQDSEATLIRWCLRHKYQISRSILTSDNFVSIPAKHIQTQSTEYMGEE